MKTLYLLRHAKTEKGLPTQEDHVRVLTERGHAEARRLGLWLREQGVTVGVILCSDAVRTRQTFEGVRAACPSLPEAGYTPRLYLPSAGELLSFMQQQNADIQSLMLIGHNPGLQDFCRLLGGIESGPARDAALQFPPATLAILRLPIVRWQELAPGIGEVTLCLTPERIAPRAETAVY